jgi:hypothetical protein
MFQQRVAAPDCIQKVETPAGLLDCYVHQLYAALPAAGVYYHEVVLIEDLPSAICCKLRDISDLHFKLESREVMLRVQVRLRVRVVRT